MILPSTAQETGGRCMPCKGGYRQSMQESKRRYEEERRYRETPAYRHWVWLVDQVHGEGAGFESLSRENKVVFAVKACIGDVYNGGFLQYFGNSASDFHEWALVGLEVIGGKSR